MKRQKLNETAQIKKDAAIDVLRAMHDMPLDQLMNPAIPADQHTAFMSGLEMMIDPEKVAFIAKQAGMTDDQIMEYVPNAVATAENLLNHLAVQSAQAAATGQVPAGKLKENKQSVKKAKRFLKEMKRENTNALIKNTIREGIRQRVRKILEKKNG